MKVIFLCKLHYHQTNGLSLAVVDADPRFVLGELELHKQDIIKRLQRSGVDKANKALRVPRLPLRIGVITSKDKDAYADFYQTLKSGGFGWRLLLADATMQGDGAESSILRALACLDQLQVDLVVLLRGGGSKTDLATLDNERIAKAIAGFRKPVWVAIGHEPDSGVLDVVAHTSFKTPTALAEEIVARFRQDEQESLAAADRIRRTWTHLLRLHALKINEDCIGIQQGSRKLTNYSRSEQRSAMEQLRRAVAERVIITYRSSDAANHELQKKVTRSVASWRMTLDSEQRSLWIKAMHEVRINRNAAFAQLSRMSDDRIYRILTVQKARILSGIDDIVCVHGKSRERRKQRLLDISRRVISSSALPRLKQNTEILKHQLKNVVAYDPRKALLRGYAIVKMDNNVLLKSIKRVELYTNIRVELFDGTVDAAVTSKEVHCE